MAKKTQAEEPYDPEDSYFVVPDATGDTRPPDEAETAVHQPYPAMRFKFAEPTMVVDNAEEDAALGDGWSKSPEALLEAPPEPEVDPIPTSKKGKE